MSEPVSDPAFDSVAAALAYLGSVPDPAELPDYRETLEFLLDHRAELPYRLIFSLPGRLAIRPIWRKVMAEAYHIKGLSGLWVILPEVARTETIVSRGFEPGEPVEVPDGSTVAFTPAGYDELSCLLELKIEVAGTGQVIMMFDPFVAGQRLAYRASEIQSVASRPNGSWRLVSRPPVGPPGVTFGDIVQVNLTSKPATVTVRPVVGVTAVVR